VQVQHLGISYAPKPAAKRRSAAFAHAVGLNSHEATMCRVAISAGTTSALRELLVSQSFTTTC
jgi:hypothetical protein